VDRDYSLREVVQILGLPRGVVAGFVAAGLVHPTRGSRREQRFDFADLVVMRAAKALVAAQVPATRIARSLRRLREHLPEARRGSLRLESIGGALVVCDARGRWRADSGQYMLAFEDVASAPPLPLQPPGAPRVPGAESDWLREAADLEERDDEAACAAYRRAIEADPRALAAYVNLGRLLHERNCFEAAREVYAAGLATAGDDALLRFNLGVLLEDMGRPDAAADAYAAAVGLDPEFADAHYNLALLHAAAGRDRLAVRHFAAYRQSQRR
jgi:tetratricopeptide (TPR) repeat protein